MAHWTAWRSVFPIAALSLGMLSNLAPPAFAEQVRITLLHLNDIYEITSVEGGVRGGMARVATLRQQLLADNPRTYTILAGDAFSPSALGTAQVEGERLAGRQMVAVMNAVGFDYATFGNHEFDLNETQFLQRLQESDFQWISSNVSNANGESFEDVPRSLILSVEGESGELVNVGIIGVTLASNPKPYVTYSDPIEAAREQVEILRNQVDILIAITHLSLFQDQQLASALPEIDLILGGHEHENVQQWRLVTPPSVECPTRGTPIFKADANARTVYVHNLYYDTETDCLQIESDLHPITAALTADPQTAQVVEEWVNRGFEGFRASGFEPEEVVAMTTEWLNGLEAAVRSQPTNLTQLIAQAMLTDIADAELAMFNGGSIRIDDRLLPGPITQYDVIRILPFGGKVLSVDIPGSLLQQVFDQGQMNRGTGGYLQTANVSQDESGQWLIQNEPLDLDRTYRVAVNDFLISGREQGLSFFTLEAPGVELIAESDDIRFAVIRQLRQLQSQSR